MTYTFRKAVREQTSVLIGLAGESGGGKTYTALRFARGLVGPTGRIVVIDTEAGRALHYADQFDFDHLDMKPPFSPMAYTEAIKAAEDAGYNAIIVDSMSHEWAGDGGCQDMHDEALERMAKGNVYDMERLSAPAWREPKMAHKRMMAKLLQCRAHLIFCLRAEEKVKFVKEFDEKKNREVTKIVPAGWLPICEKAFMFEMTASFMLHSERPGYGVPTKLQQQHKPFFNLDAPLDEKAGQLLAQWASGGAKGTAAPQTAIGSPVKESGQVGPTVKSADDAAPIDAEQAGTLVRLLMDNSIPENVFLLAAKGADKDVTSIASIKSVNYQRCLDWIDRKVERMQERTS